ncbi:D-alanyl-D-alanine carboxypeptidase/D-alanyl-D-alanine-endopeptidase [Urechidicola vernalis]|uniref:D-alanyl-D-alanine carboxypeptidase n=1 Tax=Urechidicola vernalis TaxID=3075600 RepID=A0ABU2YAD8_9FLAO|nr:D-alanyl-D-alanine carboxypeptidase [Urechidicola sp. P050]MDT0554215.1 D-alanyl-D-alanine carboxypeptidase [Urechidicola sp. P050]
MVFRIFCCGLLAILLTNCKTAKLNRTLSSSLESSFYSEQFTGLYIYDIAKDKVLLNHNGNKYFTPASNTKIFTLYTGLTLLPDSIPSFYYESPNDSTITIQGNGDPTLFHPYFKDSTAYNLVKDYKHVNLVLDNIEDRRYAPGWAWEDFDSYFSPERSALPIYGNVVTVSNENSLKVAPGYFKEHMKIADDFYGRKEFENTFYYKKGRTKETEIPMIMKPSLVKVLLEDVIEGEVTIVKQGPSKPSELQYSIPSDSLYRRMMEVSDNFLAEQILILASSTISDTLSSDKARDYMLKNELKDLKQVPRWVDGSGLSRYNLFSPASFVQVLSRMYQEIDRDRLLQFFPVGGEFGTIENWYAGKDKPYVYAKTGSLGNNHNLSGFLITDSGKVLVFSFMNNHYKHSNNAIKERMETMFEWLRDNY